MAAEVKHRKYQLPEYITAYYTAWMTASDQWQTAHRWKQSLVMSTLLLLLLLLLHHTLAR